VQWWTGTVFGGPTAQTFHDRVPAAGQLLLLTGDLATYSSAHPAGSPPTFKELFADGNRAACGQRGCRCRCTCMTVMALR